MRHAQWPARRVERQVKLSGNFESHREKLERLCSPPEGLRQAVALGLIEYSEKTAKTIRGTVKTGVVETEPKTDENSGIAQITNNQPLEVDKIE